MKRVVRVSVLVELRLTFAVENVLVSPQLQVERVQ
jgi:hypothetical protein